MLTTTSTLLQFWEYCQKVGKIYSLLKTAKSCFEDILGYDSNKLTLGRFLAECKNVVTDFEKRLKTNPPIFLVPSSKNCPICNKVMTLDKNKVSITYYDDEIGANEGWRYKRKCRSCNLTDFGSFYSASRLRYLNMTNNEEKDEQWFLSLEDTAFSKKMFEKYNFEVLVGTMTFKSKCDIFNKVFWQKNEKIGCKRKEYVKLSF